jgi:hypothetical protein
MRETRSDGQNGSDQSDDRKNIEDRLAPCRPLSDLGSPVGDLGFSSRAQDLLGQPFDGGRPGCSGCA